MNIRKAVEGLHASRVGRLLAMVLILIGATHAALAQQITGNIVGTVKDPQGAVIPGATVTATNTDTGFARTSASDALGTYTIQYLPVGPYKVEVSATGFTRFLQQNLVLTVEQTQTLNVSLAVGDQGQTVTVIDTPPPINTSTAELGRTLEPNEIIGLPLVNRNVYSQLSLTAGVQANNSSNGSANFVLGIPATIVQVNGSIDEGDPTVSYFLDGGINMTGIRNYGNQLPNPDALQEFRVDTANFSAQYGRMSGAVVTALTRSGTNKIHGSVFEFVRNTAFNATPWGQPVKFPFHRNQFGGTLGGPVLHDKAFFFFSYAGLRQVTGTALSGAIVPSALERTGNFSQSKVLPIDPATGQPYNYNNTPGWIPPSALDVTATNIINKLLPTSNIANNGWTGSFKTPLTDDEYLGKYDHAITGSDHLSISYFTINTIQNAYGGGNLPWSVNQSHARQQNVNISDVHSFNANTANQAWFTFTRVAGGRVNTPTTSISDLGSSFTTQGPTALPQITVSGYFTVGGAFAGPVSVSDFYSVRDMISMTKGKHTLAYGAEVSLEKDMGVGNLINFGQFNFSTSTPGSTKNALADFVTGKVGSMEQDTPTHSLINSLYYGFFVQDNYRLTPRLTLNLGLRYDLSPSPTESQDLTATFRAGVQSTVVPTAPMGLLFVGDAGVPRGLVSTRAHHVSPRVGIVWDPFGDGKTAIRAGGGLFFGSVTGNEWNQPSGAQPFGVRQTFNSIASLTNVYGNPASFPNGNPFPYVYNPKSPRFLPAASVETISQNFQWPYTYQINAAVERQLPSKISVSAAYVSTLTHDVPIQIDGNYATYAAGASASQASINSRRAYDPGVLGQNQLLISNQTSSYHGLQITAHRPLTHNVTLNGFYVLSHTFISAVGNAVGINGSTQNYFNLSEERGPADNDQRHMASLSGIWTLDYYHGSNFLARQLANGWTISPIVSLNSGVPLNVLTGSDNNFDGYTTDRPNRVSGVSAFLDPHRSRSTAAAAWFNKAAFTPNAPGMGIGPGGADGNTSRNYLRSPGYRDIDLGVFRDFTLPREIKFQLRAEASNAFNLVSLGAPNATLSSANAGKILSAQGTPRQLQLGARLTF